MIIQLIYRDKGVAPRIIRVTVKQPPKTIICNDAVFQNLKIVYVKNNLIHQYREVPAVNISTIELNCPVSIKFKPKPPTNEALSTSVLAITRPLDKDFEVVSEKFARQETIDDYAGEDILDRYIDPEEFNNIEPSKYF